MAKKVRHLLHVLATHPSKEKPMSELSDVLEPIESCIKDLQDVVGDLQSAIDALALVTLKATDEREDEAGDPVVPDDKDIEELPAPNGRPKGKRRARPKKEGPPDPTVDDCITALMEIIDNFEDGAEIVRELIGEVQPGTEIISKVTLSNRQGIIDAVAKYLEECPKDEE